MVGFRRGACPQARPQTPSPRRRPSSADGVARTAASLARIRFMSYAKGLRRTLGSVCVFTACCLAWSLAQAATITIVNMDGWGEGFNDATPTAPVGGNGGTTRGQQRVIAFQHAADLWGQIIESNVEIRVRAA